MAVAAAVATGLLTGCSGSFPSLDMDGSPTPISLGEARGGEEHPVAQTDSFDPVHVVAGTVQTVVVPDQVKAAHVVVKGARGYSPYSTDGLGAVVEGDLAVAPGDELTMIAAGGGAPPNGNKAPGGGGWSIQGFEGGQGGSGRGSQTSDGGGGGGASLIKVNGEVRAVAGGGGGAGGSITKGGFAGSGGSAGADRGDSALHEGGRGGSSEQPSLNTRGGSIDAGSKSLEGGGGGGGWHSGEGGKADSDAFGRGGGGGDSLYRTLSNAKVRTGYKIDESGTTYFGNNANGDVTLSWVAVVDSSQDMTLQKIDAPSTQMLESPVTGTRGPGAAVDTHHRTIGDDGKVVANQQWTYKFYGGRGAGSLINKSTGLCLEVNRTSGQIDQWNCDENGPNQLWRLIEQSDGVHVLAVDLDRPIAGWKAMTYYLGTSVENGDAGNGTSLTLLSDPTNDVDPTNNVTAWKLTEQ